MWAPLPACAGSSIGTNVARLPSQRATSRTISLKTHAAVGAADALRRARSVSRTGARRTPRRSAPARGPRRRSAPITRGGNAPARRCASSENGSAAGARSPSSWNSCSKLADQTRPELLVKCVQRVAQIVPRAADPRRSVGLDDVAQDQLKRPRLLVQAHVRGGIGQQAQVADGPERVRVGQRPERGQRVVGRDPADALRHVGGQLGGGQRASPHDDPRSQQTSETRSVVAHPAVRGTVPLSQIASRRPSRRRAARGSAPRAGGDHGEHAALGHVAPLERRRQVLARLQVHAAGRRATGRCRRSRTGCRPGPRRARRRTRSARRCQSGAGPSYVPSQR